jgi:glycosyltransferase involved in cell wall biosynthesis
VQLLIDQMLRSSLGRDFEIHTVNTSKNVLRWAVETRTWRTPIHFARDLWRLLSALARVRPDVVVVHSAQSLSFMRDWAFMALSRISGARVVCHYHGTLHARFPSAETPLGRWAGRILISAAHRVIVVSPSYRAGFAEAWRRANISWAPNGTEVARYSRVEPTALPSWLKPGERGVLFMGRLSAPKGIWDLIDAIPAVLARHPEARFLLGGVAENVAQEPILREAVAARGIASRVTFLGSVEGDEKIQAYASASLFVLPSWTEAFPLVIPEAMAAGLPLVVTSVGAIPDFVIEGEDGFLVPPRDPAALARAVIRLLDNPELCQRISGRVRERARLEFDIEVGASRVGAVLREVLGERRRS